jgi:hypothetical protein
MSIITMSVVIRVLDSVPAICLRDKLIPQADVNVLRLEIELLSLKVVSILTFYKYILNFSSGPGSEQD